MKRLLVLGLLGLAFSSRGEAQEVVTVAPSATLTIDGLSTSGVSFTSFTRRSNGYIVGTVDGVGLKRSLSKAFRQQDGRATRPLILRLTPAPGAPPVVMVGILQPADDGTSLSLRAVPVGNGPCDPTSLKDSLTELNAQKSAIETRLLALESSIVGAELADAAVCSHAFKSAVDTLTLEIAAAAFLGDFPLVAELTGRLYALNHNPFDCDPAGVATLTSVLQSAESQLATVDLAIRAVLEELRACVSGS
jgi:hypothetical protein